MTLSLLRNAALLVAASLLFTGCQFGSEPASARSLSTPAELQAAIARATDTNQPLILLVAESGHSPPDARAIAAFESEAKRQTNGIVFLLLDISVSRTRATAARFHILETPLLMCLSPRGINISRDGAPVTRSLIEQRVAQAVRQSPDLDELLALAMHTAAVTDDALSKLAPADFLMAHHNAFEAIPRLEAVAHSETAPPATRVRAWVELAQARLWIGEVEKCRHEAQALMAELGPTTPDAVAGGNLVLGTQDAVGKNLALARKDYEAAIAAAPDSPYGRQAAKSLQDLP